MAVEQRKDLEYRGFSGYEDPRYPSGMYEVEGAMIGDATGGNMVLLFDYSLATSPFNSQFYSLEDIRITTFQAVDALAELAVVNFDSSVTTRYTMELVANESGFASLRLNDALAVIGLFLGRQSSRSANMSLSITLDNDDTILTRAFIAGYLWSARSVAVPGGPQRPPTGLYRS